MSEPIHPTTDQHTPGPWRLLKPGSLCIEAPDGNVAVVNFARASNADALLIAAAPDLLALAKQYLSECSECNGSGTTWDRDNCTHTIDCPDCADIRAVIAKAEGKAHV